MGVCQSLGAILDLSVHEKEAGPVVAAAGPRKAMTYLSSAGWGVGECVLRHQSSTRIVCSSFRHDCRRIARVFEGTPADSPWAEDDQRALDLNLDYLAPDGEPAYARSDVIEKRRRLMEAWATYCASSPAPASDKVVVPLRSA